VERLRVLQSLARPAESKMLLLVLDGVGGLPDPETGVTELEAASLPHLDALAARASTGRTQPIGTGIATGSGPGHLQLFGYPLSLSLPPRGVLEVLGAERCYHRGVQLESDFELTARDLTARGNFALVEPGTLLVTDRRGGYPSNAVNERLVRRLSEEVRIDGVEVYLFPGMEHRFAVAFRGDGLRGPLSDTDPLVTGLRVIEPQGAGSEQDRAIEVVNQFMAQAHQVLGHAQTPNYAMLRGIGTAPELPSLQELYRIRSAALAVYPMYRGVARLAGMTVLPTPSRADQLGQIEERFGDFDLFFVHVKETDSAGHRGDFDGKVKALEEADAFFGQLMDYPWDVITVTGDHSTPTLLREHSHHPVPTMVWSATCLADRVTRFTERDVLTGSLGTIPARDLLGLVLAEAGRLAKFGA
jgi:2,3-bisphosphoglycerate-independent phosphoglycerate mutase